jgi:hypothetical protein
LIVIAPFPIIVITEDGDRRDAIIPILVGVIGKPEAAQVEHVMIDHAADAAEVIVSKDAKAGSAEYAHGTNSVVESRRHRGPALTVFEAEVVSSKTTIFIEAGTALRRMWPAPFVLGKCRQRGNAQQ